MSQSNITISRRITRTGILTTGGDILGSDSSAVGELIQNLGTNQIFVKFGTTASSTDFDIVIPGGTGNDNGTGGMQQFPIGPLQAGLPISVAGTSPRFTISRFFEK